MGIDIELAADRHAELEEIRAHEAKREDFIEDYMTETDATREQAEYAWEDQCGSNPDSVYGELY